jgi:phage shock protein C
MEAAEMDRLYRSRDDRMLAGVAGGLAELWDADPALIRIVWALLVIFTGGVALLVYIVMAIVVPE